MARYIENEYGVRDTQAPAHDIRPADYVEWQEYQAWLAAGNVPDPQVIVARYPTLAMQRDEALARLDGILGDKRERFQVTAVGHTWAITPRFFIAILIHRAATPPMPPGFGLPDATRTNVALTNNDLSALIGAISSHLIAINARYFILTAAVVASATPLAVDLTTGWPT